MLTVFPLFYAAMACVRFLRLPESFTETQKAESIDSFLHSCTGLMALSGLYAAGEILFLALGGARDRMMDELLGLACMVGIGILAALSRAALRKGAAPTCGKNS
jgi:hypothetical protein